MTGIEGEDTGVHFGNKALIWCGILFLDDARDFAVVGADDATVTLGIVLVNGQNRHRSGDFGVGSVEVGQGLCLQEGNVSVGDDDGSFEALQCGKRTLQEGCKL